MAEFLWTLAVQEVLKKIVKFGAEQIGVAWELENELSLLKEQLRYADTILEDINRSKKSHPGNSVNLWLEKLEDIVLEADDLLDELVYEHLRRTVEHTEKFRKVRDSISLSKNSFLFRRKMSKKIKNITQTLNKHYLLASTFGLVGVESATETEVALKQIRETISILDCKVVGRETEVSKLLKLVIDSTCNGHHTSVISIVGMGGLGKTTLAKKIFNHVAIKEHFDQTIWVCVSKPSIIMKILEQIFQGLSGGNSGLISEEALLPKIQEMMQGKKYFLVLDDVWDQENNGLWDKLSGCLKHIAGKSGNGIMVTTRNVEVATMVESIYIHDVEKLSDDQCWALFRENANANQLPTMNSKLEIMKDELVRKMGGVPLVAKVLGGAVKFEGGDYESWMTEVESIAKNISREDKDCVSSILKLSVDSLPNLVLKQCFAYCSNFPQDYNFRIDELIQMWIAQGFIQLEQERENLLMEDIGEHYFNFLLSRSLFQDVTRDENKRIVGFKMHDLMHDIACLISSHQKMESNPNSLSGKSARKFRTLICDYEEIDYKVQDDIVCLRVLKLNMHQLKNLWVPTNQLIHLRYLDISGCDVNKLLHEFLSLLYNLQTLKLGYYRSDHLPKNLSKLVNLRHLEFQKNMFDTKLMVSHIGNLIHLQTLPEFVVGLEKGCKIEELGPLKNLKGTLALANLTKVQNKEEVMTAKLREKKNLHRLIFQYDFYEIGEYHDEDNNIEVLEGLQPHKNLQSLEIRGFQGQVMPNNIFVENLVDINLFKCERCEVLPMLGQLRKLKKLEIYSMNNVRRIGNEFYGVTDSNQQRNCFAFPQLKELYIEYMKKLEEWDEAAVNASNVFGCLKKLRICGCRQLAKLPSGLEGCHSIEYLEIYACRKLMLNVQNLHNLYHLYISGMKSLPEGLDKLTNLKKLIIKGRMQNYEFSSFVHLSSQLVQLELTDYRSSDNARTNQLPQQLQHLTNLKFLEIEKFDGIEALPEWFGNLTSLTTLKCSNCKNLKELPSREAMLRLTKLKELEIHQCPEISEGQERAKLSDLPIKLWIRQTR